MHDPAEGHAHTSLVPLVDGGAAPSVVQQGTFPRRGDTCHTVLVVDDEPAVLALAIRVIQRAGWQTSSSVLG